MSITITSKPLTIIIFQQSKFFQLKSSALSIVLSSVLVTLNRLKYFIIVYYIILGVYILIICYTLDYIINYDKKMCDQ